jgi:formamidopyrimidine-DNA glycosylase
MPELPDVEVFRQYLEATSLHQTVKQVDVLNEGILSGISSRQLEQRVKNHRFDSSQRRGKYLFAHLNSDGWLVFHFGMRGYLIYFKEEKDKPPKHTRLIFHFTNDYRIAYSSQRKLGRISFVENPEDFIKNQSIGPDALRDSTDLSAFSKVLKNTKSTIKSALMNQNRLAGVGNIYSDEILFQARIHPKTKANQLDGDKIRRLFDTMKEVLKTAIDEKVDPEHMPNSYLLPHRQKRGKCPVCGGNLKIEKTSGRTAYYCPRCQS